MCHVDNLKVSNADPFQMVEFVISLQKKFVVHQRKVHDCLGIDLGKESGENFFDQMFKKGASSIPSCGPFSNQGKTGSKVIIRGTNNCSSSHDGTHIVHVPAI